MGSEQQFCLRWHNYQSSLLASLPQLLDGDDLTDVTLMAGGCNLKAHRVVLSACSQYFKELFKVLQPLQHPVIVLPGAKFSDLCALVTFMYSGEVKIYQDQLQGLLSMADALQIRGLAEVNSNPGKPAHSDIGTSPPQRSSPGRKRQRSNLTSDTIAAQPLPDASFKQPDNDVYASMMRALSGTKHTSEDSDAHCSSYDRPSGYVDHFDSLELNRRNIRVKNPTPDEPGVKQEVAIEKRIKTEQERVDCNVATELETVMRSSKHMTLEDMEMAATKMYGVGDDQSPSSNDSAHDGSYTSFIADSDRVQSLSAGSNLSKNPSTSSSQYVYQACGQIIGNSKLFATCFVCGKQLSNQYNLRVHMETHQNVNYACTVCSHVSRSRDALRKHVSYRHPAEAKGGSSTEGQVGEGVSGKIKKSKVVPNKDNNNNKKTLP